MLYLADENFGILKRDVEIAKIIKEAKLKFGYPQSISFYNDKRFTETSREVLEVLGDISKMGVTLSLQTENPEVLKAINRRNVTNEEIDNAIMWANKLNISTSTELIFGLPYETKASYVDTLNKSIDRGFDAILSHALFIMDGIELNRPDVRKNMELIPNLGLLIRVILNMKMNSSLSMRKWWFLRIHLIMMIIWMSEN